MGSLGLLSEPGGRPRLPVLLFGLFKDDTELDLMCCMTVLGGVLNSLRGRTDVSFVLNDNPFSFDLSAEKLSHFLHIQEPVGTSASPTQYV